MLCHLSIRDIVLIDRLDLPLGPGLGVLTGETGTGKSILLDGLSLALGGRGDATLIRDGTGKASITAQFELSPGHPALDLLAEQDIASDGAALVLRRTLNSDGRGRAFVNDQPVSVGLLRRLGELLVEIQGQHELHGLIDPSTHVRLLDAFGGLDRDTEKTEHCHAGWRSAEQALAEAQADHAQTRRDEAWLREAVEKLEELAPQAGEEARLAETRKLAQHAEQVAEALTDAAEQLAGEAGAEAGLQRVLQRLNKVANVAGERLTEVIGTLDRAAAELGEASRDLQSLAGGSDLDPDAASIAEERLFALRAASRRHEVEVDALAGELDALKAKLNAIEHGEEAILDLARAVDAGKRDYIAAAEALSKKRAKAAARLDLAVADELPPLKLENAGFRTVCTRLDEANWGARGLDEIRFEVQTNPGGGFGPIDKIASGGELARFLLAVKVVLAATSPNLTLIFDEVDSGIGGATAAAVGQRLARLADTRQVLVVTHSPQVAAVGATHLQVTKKPGAKSTTTEVAEITDTVRTEEIARMISGAKITDEARAAAIELIKGAAAP